MQTRSFVWDTFAAMLGMPNDTASVAVIDGSELAHARMRSELTTARLLVTPFRTQNTPPPMSSYVINLPSTPVNVSCSTTDDSVAVLFDTGLVQVYDLNTKIPDPKSGSKLRGGGKVAEPQLKWEAQLAPEGAFAAKQVALAAGEVAVLFWSDKCEGGVIVTARDGQIGQSKAVKGDVERLIWGEEAGWLVLNGGGTLVAGEREIPRSVKAHDSIRRRYRSRSVCPTSRHQIRLEAVLRPIALRQACLRIAAKPLPPAYRLVSHVLHAHGGLPDLHDVRPIVALCAHSNP